MGNLVIIVDLKNLIPSWPMFAPLPSLSSFLITQIANQKSKKKKKKKRKKKKEKNKKLKLKLMKAKEQNPKIGKNPNNNLGRI